MSVFEKDINNGFIQRSNRLKDLENIIDCKVDQLQHLLGSDEDNTISALRNEHSKLTSDCTRLIRQKASLNKEIIELQSKKKEYKNNSSCDNIREPSDFSETNHIELKNYNTIPLLSTKEDEVSIKDPRDIVKDLLNKSSGIAKKESNPILSEEDKVKFRKESLDLAYQASFKDGLFNMKWPVLSNSLPANPTKDEVLQHQLDVLSSQLETLFSLAKYNFEWIVTGELKNRYD